MNEQKVQKRMERLVERATTAEAARDKAQAELKDMYQNQVHREVHDGMMEGHKGRINFLTQELEHSRARRTEAQAEVDRLHGDIDRLTAEKNHAEETVSAMSGVVERLTLEAKQWQTKCEALEKEFRELDVKKLQKRLALKSQEHQATRDELANRNAMLQELHQKATAILNESSFLKGLIPPEKLEEALKKKAEEVAAIQRGAIPPPASRN